MSSFFKPKVQIPEPQAAPPTINEAADRQDLADRLRKRRGRASTILVPNSGAAPAPATVLGG
jgi:hypothetical protein